MNLKGKKDYFKETLKDYLSFSRNERRGLFAVILILFTLIIIRVAIEYWPQKPEDFSKTEKEINDFFVSKKPGLDSSDKKINRQQRTAIGSYSPNEDKKSELFNFNPNGLSAEDWKRLGFSERQIRVIKNYEAKGGKFYTKDDVKKMYSISPEEYRRIEPYISIPANRGAYENKFPPRPSYDDLKVDVGSADTTEIKKLRGIGTVYANRIVKYRTKLGGFYSVNQLHEVWGLNDSLYNEIAPHVYVADSNNLTKININAATFNELKAHPYFSYNLANALVNYRIQHGAFKVIADIRRMPLVDEELYRKIAPYLKVE